LKVRAYMNQFYNPLFLLRIAQSYLSEVNRIWNFDEQQLASYKDKAFRKTVNFAYSQVPLYHQKYKEHGVHPEDIKGISDIKKLPFISKDDLRNGYPKDIVPRRFKEQNNILVSTSGSTGKPVFLYHDRLSAIKSLEGFLRVLKAYGGNWRKTRIILVIDMEPGSIEHTLFSESVSSFLKRFISMDNIKYLHIGDDPKDLMKKINDFSPEFIGSDPNMLRKFAVLKNKGIGEDIAPEFLFSSGSMLDSYTKRYIEHAFSSRIIDMYGTTEAGPLAFECVEGGYYHVHSDFVHLEFLDQTDIDVGYGTSGRLVVSKLYGTATPIIRYLGIEDMVTPIMLSGDCCGLQTQLIQSIQGRYTDLIVLPDGRLLSALTITGVPAKVMEKFNSYKIKQFQIIQHDTANLEVLIVIDDAMRSVGVPVDELLKELQKQFSDRLGAGMSVSVKEVDEIQKDDRSDYVKVVISKIKPSEFQSEIS
jgi:phenylacetate-CoA ligase